MQVQTKLADDIDSAGMEAQYDKNAKKLLVHKNILSWILKECVEEYKELSLKEDEVLRIFLNLEIQRDPQAGYPLEKRVVYYLSRMISAQYGTVFTHSQYGKIRKVYSIWIIPDPAKYRRNTIRKLTLKAEDVLGNYSGKKSDYDLMTGLILSLSGDEDESDNQALRLLDVLFSDKKEPKEKKEILEKDYQIPYTAEIGNEVENMCNLSQGILEKGKMAGKAEGKAEGENLLGRLMNILLSENLVDEAKKQPWIKTSGKNCIKNIIWYNQKKL